MTNLLFLLLIIAILFLFVAYLHSKIEKQILIRIGIFLIGSFVAIMMTFLLALIQLL